MNWIHLIKKPHTIFFIDGLGALATAMGLLFILLAFQETIGIPQNILAFLAAIALLFVVFSLSCFFMARKIWKPYLKTIMIGNLAYCLLTLIILIYFTPLLNIWAFAYFSAEILLICTLVRIEYNIIKMNM